MNINFEERLLQPSLIEMVEIFNASKSEYVSTLDFLSKGVLSPAAGIVRLKEHGAIIDTITRTVIDRKGRARKRIAHYKLVGWKQC